MTGRYEALPGEPARPATAELHTHVVDALGRLWRIIRADGQVVGASVDGWFVIYVR